MTCRCQKVEGRRGKPQHRSYSLQYKFGCLCLCKHAHAVETHVKHMMYTVTPVQFSPFNITQNMPTHV